MNILFYGQLQQKGLRFSSVHIYEVLSNLSKLGHNAVLTNASYPKDEMEIDAIRQLALWARIKGCLLSVGRRQPLKGGITILWLFSLLSQEIRIFFSGFVTMLRQKGGFDLIYRRHTLFNSEHVLAKLFKIPSVREVNGIVADETKISNEGDRISLWIIDKVERFNMPRADKIIVVTSKLKEVLQRDYGVPEDKIVVIPNGANTDLFKPMDVLKARRELGLSRSDDCICFVGSLERWQGVEYLIKSLALILEQCPETRFLIVGDGPMKQELTELAEQVAVSSRVIFTGMVPYQKVPLYMNASDICVAPKAGLRSGYSPLKLCEYMACSKPVVASRASGLEILEYSKAGMLVTPESPLELATAIMKLLRNQELRKKMGENGRKYVVENQSWESVAKRVAEVCEAAILSCREE